MSCGCNDNAFGYSPYGTICQPDTPYPSTSSESVPSLINNLTYSLYGQITKSVSNGQVVWTIPCDPNQTASINGLTRNTGEGLLCYILRCLNTSNTPTPTYTTITAGNYIANQSISSASNIGAYSYGTLSYADSNILSSYSASVNSYIEAVIQNTNNSNIASADFVLSNNLGTATTYFANFGINSSGFGLFTGTGTIAGTTLTIATATSGGLSVGSLISYVVSSVTYTATISALGTGTGGVGTYTLSGSPTAAPTTTAITATIPCSLSLPNASYVSATSGDLVLGTTTSNSVRIVTNSATTDAVVIDASGNVTTNGVTKIYGTQTNDNATANYVGYVVKGQNTAGNVYLSTGGTSMVTSISLPAGDWDVRGQVNYNAAATTSITILKQGISTASATFGGQDTFTQSVMAAVVPTASNDIGLPVRTQRISLASTTPIYLVCNATFSLSSLSAYGTIEARRVR
jgi:hypothetical protein